MLSPQRDMVKSKSNIAYEELRKASAVCPHSASGYKRTVGISSELRSIVLNGDRLFQHALS